MLEKLESKEVVHGGWSVCVGISVFIDSGGERLNSDCLVLVPEVRFSGSEPRTALNTSKYHSGHW